MTNEIGVGALALRVRVVEEDLLDRGARCPSSTSCSSETATALKMGDALEALMPGVEDGVVHARRPRRGRDRGR